jgi:Bacterial Ig-like domain
MRRTIVLIATMSLTLLVASGVALAAPTDESALCQNTQRVLEPVTFTGNDTTNTFTTTTNGFRVNYEGSSFDPAPPDSTAVIRIQDEASQPVPGASETIDANADTSVFFNLPPGTYRVDVNLDPLDAESKSYIVSVDQCGETATAPKVISTFPRNGGEVGPAANIRATFSEDMRPASVMNAFKLFRKGSTNQIAAAVTYDAATDIATLNPTNNLRRGATYKAVVTTVAKDMAGNRLDQNDSTGGLQQKKWFFEID